MMHPVQIFFLILFAVLCLTFSYIIVSGAFPPGGREARKILAEMAKDDTIPLDERLKIIDKLNRG